MPTIISNSNNNSFDPNLFFKQLNDASNDKLPLMMYNAYIKSIIGYNATSIDTLIDGLSDSMKNALVIDEQSIDPKIITINDLKNKLKNVPKYNGVFRKLHAIKFAPKRKEYLDIAGFKNPKIIIQEGRDFTIVTETIHKDDSKNIGVIIKDNNKDIKIEDSLYTKSKYMGGGDIYYQKYLKYKNKYLSLKNQIGGVLPAGRRLTIYDRRLSRNIVGLDENNATITKKFAEKVLDNTIRHQIMPDNKIMFIFKSDLIGFIRNTNRKTLFVNGIPYVLLASPLPDNIDNLQNERLVVHCTDLKSDSILLSELLNEMHINGVNHSNFYISIISHNHQNSKLIIDPIPYDWHWEYE